MESLQDAFDAGQLRLFSDLASLADPATFCAQLAGLKRIEWVVYAKAPFGGPEQVLAYWAATPIASLLPTAAS